MRALQVFFSWPDGGVWSNLLASFILGVPAFIRIRLHQKRHYESLDLLHRKIDGLKGEKKLS